MQVKKVWSYILIVLSVIVFLWGAISFYGVYNSSQQMDQLSEMGGGMMNNVVEQGRQASPSYTMPVILILLGIAGGVGGSYMLKSSTMDENEA